MTTTGTPAAPRAFWRRRPVVTALLSFAALLVAVLVMAIVARETLLTMALRSALVAYGVPGADFTVDRISLQQVELRDVRAGSDDELSIRQLTVTLSAAALLERRVAAIVIDDLRLQIAIGEDSVSMGSLDPLLRQGDADTDAAADATPVPLPQVTVRKLSVTAATPAGTVTAALDGDATLAPDGAVAANGMLDLASPFAAVTGALVASGTLAGDVRASYQFAQASSSDAVLAIDSGRVDIAGQLTQLQVDADIREAADASQWTVQAMAGPTPTATLDARLEAGSALWALAGVAAPTRGRIDLHLAGDATPFADDAAGRTAVLPARIAAELQLRADGVDHPIGLHDLTGRFDARLDNGDEAMHLTVTPDTRITMTATGIDLPLLDGPVTLVPARRDRSLLDLTLTRRDSGYAMAVDAAPRLQSGKAARFSALAAGSVTVASDLTVGTAAFDDVDLQLSGLALPGLRVEDAGWRGSIHGRPSDLAARGRIRAAVRDIVQAPLTAAAVDVTAEAAVDWQGDAVEFRLMKPATVTAGPATYDGAARLPSPTQLAITTAAATVSLHDATADFAASLAPAEIAAQIDLAATPEPVALAWQAMRVDGKWSPQAGVLGRLDLDGGLVAAPQRQIALHDITLSAKRTDTNLVATLETARLVDEATPARVAPLRLAGRAHLRHGIVNADLSAGLVGREDWPIRLSLLHSLDDGTGSARLQDAVIAFAPDGLQPRDIAPALSMVSDAAGRIEAGADVSWTRAGLDGVGQVRATGVSFRTPDARVDGLELQMLFKDLQPMESASGQLLKIAQVEAAVPMRDIEVRFSLAPSSADAVVPELRIERAQTRVLGGTIAMEPLVIKPGAELENVVLRPSDFDLGELLTLIAVDGLSGSGRVSGRVPVSARTDGIAIVEAVLSADEAGVIRYQSDAAKSALAGQGSQTELMLQALENFQFKRLSITIDKTPAGDAQVTLRMLGANPDVLDGHPFQFNINVTGNVDKLVGPVLEIYRTSSGLLGRLGGVKQ